MGCKQLWKLSNGNSLQSLPYNIHFEFLKQAIDRMVRDGFTEMTSELRFES